MPVDSLSVALKSQIAKKKEACGVNFTFYSKFCYRRNAEFDNRVVIRKLKDRISELEAQVKAARESSPAVLGPSDPLDMMEPSLSEDDQLLCHKILHQFFHGKIDNPVLAGMWSEGRRGEGEGKREGMERGREGVEGGMEGGREGGREWKEGRREGGREGMERGREGMERGREGMERGRIERGKENGKKGGS